MKMRVAESGSDGNISYEAGIVNIWPGHAQKVFRLNHGCPVDKDNKDLPFDEAVKALKLSKDDIATATLNREKK